jgi:hypothetical protein
MASFFFYPYIATISNLTIGTTPDVHGHGIGAHASHGPEGTQTDLQASTIEKKQSSSDIESQANQPPTSSDHHDKGEGKDGFNFDDSVLAQMVGVGILEFGVLLHRCGKFISYAQRCSDIRNSVYSLD